ncbi:MAG: hypothetical protein AB7I34_26610 [Rhizobiaceae bacterium]
MNIANTPTLPPALLDWLDRKYAERSPDPKDSEREIWMKAGERRLVRHLLLRAKEIEDQGISAPLLAK